MADMEREAINKADPSQETTESVEILEMVDLPLEPDINECENSEDFLSKVTERVNMSEETLALYSPLRRAIQQNDWEGVRKFVKNKDPRQALTDKITEISETLFHLLAQSDHDGAFLLLKDLVPMSIESLELRDSTGSTAFSYAAAVGNTKAAKLFVRFNGTLPNIFNDAEDLPIHMAAFYGQKETVQYLLPLTTILEDLQDLKDFAARARFRLVTTLIQSNLYGIALDLLKRHSDLDSEQRRSILELLAEKPLGFQSGSRHGCWHRLIYQCIPAKDKNILSPHTKETDSQNSGSVHDDMENPIQRSINCSMDSKLSGFLRKLATTFGGLRQQLNLMFWNAFMRLAPSIKRVHDEKLMHMRSLEIVKTTCVGVVWNYQRASEILKDPVLTAARFGISEIVNEIMEVYENIVLLVNNDGNNLFQLAVLHRREKVFNLIYTMGPLKGWVAFIDKSRNNIFHLAGRLVPSSKIAGAAFQMQREVQWFKAVENLVHPSMHEDQNSSMKTPSEVFVEEHKKLVEEGEKWMKETATSCTVVAALIITVVFAAAFTAPGGIDNEGLPVFLHEPSFIVFAISDALALFSSTTSVLMFLGILTARYTAEDFLKSLPTKLIIGLITLFFSIASMMVAFGATFYIALSRPWKFTIIPTSLFGCLTVTLFALMQFPLLVEMILSTYGPSIFQPK